MEHFVRHARQARFLARIVLVVVAAMAASAALAAPAPAAPTDLRVAPQRPTVAWGGTLILNGVLTQNTVPPLPLDQQQVLVQRSVGGLAPWTTVDTVTNTSAPYSSGAYMYSETAMQTWFWRMYFPGTSEWATVTSNVVRVSVRPVLGRPSCPRTIKPGKRFTVAGSLKPRFAAGSRTVKVRAQRYTRGKWRAYRIWSARNADSGSYSSYAVRVSLSTRGRYRFFATTTATQKWAAATSAYSRTLTVK